MFSAVQKSRVYTDIVEQIRDAIISGKLKPGDRLPPERTLQELFETSRITVREALRVLEHDGVLEIRTGSKGGAYVLEPSVGRVRTSLSMLLEYRNVPLSELAEFREALEGDVTTLAAGRAGAEVLSRLESLLVELDEAVKEGTSRWSDMLRLDDRFHMILAAGARNVLYEIVLETVHRHIGLYYHHYLRPDPHLMQKNLNDLRNIYQAVRSRDTGKAESLARDHVESFNRIMIDSWDGKLGAVLQPRRGIGSPKKQRQEEKNNERNF
ncbi:MAG: FadR family transcriptional regulator [Spirochaetales bacterium]|nr:FadR family transcriptional regulator [Spirochaetales bacterium]